MATLLLRIEGLEPADRSAVERALRAMPGVYGAVVSAAEGCAEVDFEDDEVSVDRLVERLRRDGFDARMAG